MRSLILLWCLFAATTILGAPPTVGTTNLGFQNIEGNSMLITMNNGNGTARLVVLRAAAPVDGLPVNGQDYSANSQYGLGNVLPGGAANNFIVAKLSGSQGFSNAVAVTGLTPNTVYHISVFEMNGTGVNTEYLVTPAQVLKGNQSTQNTPGTQGSITSITAITGHSMRVNLAPGNGTNRVLVCKQGSVVNATPVDLVNYSTSSNAYSSFLTAPEISNGNKVVWNTNNANNITEKTTVVVGDLNPNTTYHFALFEFNGTTGAVFNVINPFISNASTTGTPTNLPASFSLTTNLCDGANGANISGNGRYIMRIVKLGAPVDFTPTNGTAYPNVNVSNLSGAADLGNGNKLIYNGTNYGATTSLSNATFSISSGIGAGTTVHVKLIEYNGNIEPGQLPPASGTIFGAGVSAQTTTVMAPTTGPGQPTIDNIGSNNLRITLGSPGNGTHRAILMRQGSDFPVEYSPSGCQQWGNSTSSPKLFNGSAGSIPFGSGNFIVYSGNGGAGTSIVINGLNTGTPYYVRVYEYNMPSGNPSPANTIQFGAANATTSFYPTSAPSGFSQYSTDGNSVGYLFTKGNGDNTFIAVKRSASPTTNPIDGVVYVANAQYGVDNGFTPPAIPSNRLVPIADSIYIISNNAGTSFSINNLKPRTTYNLRAISFNGTVAGNTYYMCNAPAPDNTVVDFSFTTLSEPTVSASNIAISNIVADKASINFTQGNGTRRVIFMKEGAPVDLPESYFTDGLFLSGNTSWDNINFIHGNQNRCMGSTTGNSLNIVSGLNANTTYHIAIYEFNGNNFPLYKVTDVARSQFTTPATPTIQATISVQAATEGNIINYNGLRGNGSNYVVLAREGSPVNATLADLGNTPLVANGQFGLGTQVGVGNFAVQANGFFGNTISLTGLKPSTTYHFAVFEYNKNASQLFYLVPGGTGSGTTISGPTLNASAIQVNNVTSTSLTLTWTPGNGQRRLVIARPSSPVNKIPQQTVQYTGNAAFGSGTHLGENNFIVFSSNTNSVNITGLAPSTTYYFDVYEYNGTSGPVYFVGTPLSASATTVSSPLGLTLLSNVNLCTSSPYTAIYTIGATYNSGNIFSVQLSDINGNFTNPTLMGSQSSTASGNILCNVPNVSAGANYRIRMVSSNPVFTSNSIPAQLINCNSTDVNAGCETYVFNNVNGTPWYSISGKNGLALQINANNQNLGFVTVQVNKSPLPFLVQGTQRYFMGRYYNITTTNPPALPVFLRIPFTTAELNEFNAADGTLDGITATPANLKISKYSGTNADCSPLNNDWNSSNQTYISPSSNTNLTNGFYVEIAVSSFSEFGAEDQNEVLPLKLIAFTGKKEKGTDFLFWSTEIELNTKHFDIEKMQPTGLFAFAGRVNAMGSGNNSYTFQTSSLESASHYRLKMVDKDGLSRYSKVISLTESSISGNVIIFPNPAKDWMQISNANGAKVKIFNGAGRLVMEKNAGFLYERIGINHLPAGIYFVEVQQGENTQHLKLIKQ